MGIGLIALPLQAGTLTVPAVGLVLATLGSGFAAPSVWAAAAAAFARPWQGVRDALFFLLYGATQIGAMLAMLVLGLTGGLGVGSGTDAGPLVALTAGAALLGALVAGGLAAAHQVLPPVPDDDPSERLDARPFGLAIGLAALAIAPWAAFMTTIDQIHGAALMSTAIAAPLSMTIVTLSSLNPLLVLAASLVGAVVAAVAALMRMDAPMLPVAAFGLLVAAVGGALGATVAAGVPAFFPVAILLVTGAESLVLPILMSRVVGDLHWRASSLMAGGWLAATAGVAAATSTLIDVGAANSPAPFPLLAGAAGCALGGIVLMAVAIPHHRLLRHVLDAPAVGPDEVA